LIGAGRQRQFSRDLDLAANVILGDPSEMLRQAIGSLVAQGSALQIASSTSTWQE